MSNRMRLRGGVVVVIAIILAVLFGGSNASAGLLDGWADIPGQSATLQEADIPDGAVHSVQGLEVPGGLDAATGETITYGTGVLRSGQAEMGTMTVFRPADPTGEVFIYAPATDSLSPLDAPSHVFQRGDTIDTTLLNAALAEGKTVIIADAYGDLNPQYAGTMNGVRMANAIFAYENLYGPSTRRSTSGFSGGGIDVGRLLEYRHTPRIDVAVVDSGPLDLIQMVTDAQDRAQTGLVLFEAGQGAYRSMSPEDQAVLEPNIRPTTKLVAKITNQLAAWTPVPRVWQLLRTVGGALLPVSTKNMFREGTYDNPAVQQALRSVNVGTGPGADTIVFRGNATDAFVQPNHHGVPLAEQYRVEGAEVTVITNHGQPAPGHAMMDADQTMALLNGDVPAGDVDTMMEMTLIDKITTLAVSGALWGISQWGVALNGALPPILNTMDAAIEDADKALQAPPSSAPIEPFVVPEPLVTSTPAPAQVKPSEQPASELSNVEVTSEAVSQIVPTEYQAPLQAALDIPVVSEFVNQLPFALAAA